MSLVVPGIGVTMAASLWAVGEIQMSFFCGSYKAVGDVHRKLSRLLFPAFGGPKMESLIPERTISPLRASVRWDSIV